jgi:capsule polysaccharide modification protein KpsS
MVPLTQIIEQHDNVLYLTDVEIHSMIKNAKATYVINSGTGQEAMLQDAKVVAFGRSEYKDAVIGGDIADLDKVWSQVQNDNTEVRKKMYRRWYDWYLNDVVFDTTI